MDRKKVMVANLYLVGTFMIVVGFIWMATLAMVEADFGQILASFFFTISGVGVWSFANWYRIKQERLRREQLKEEYLRKLEAKGMLSKNPYLAKIQKKMPHIHS